MDVLASRMEGTTIAPRWAQKQRYWRKSLLLKDEEQQGSQEGRCSHQSAK